MRPQSQIVPIASIQIGERIRQDLGDLQSLADSLRKSGLLQPIIVDEELRLLAGERRLRAAILAGITEIEVRIFYGLSDIDKELVELDENRQRKDFGPHELARYWVEKKEYVQASLKMLAEKQRQEAERERAEQRRLLREQSEQERREFEARLKAVVAKEEEIAARLREFDARLRDEEDSLQNCSPADEAVATSAEVAGRLGIHENTVRLAEKHVAAMDKYRFLDRKDWNQQAALEVAGRLDEIEAKYPGAYPALRSFLTIAADPKKVRAALKAWSDSSPEKQTRMTALLAGTDPVARDQVLAALVNNRLLPDDRRVKLHGIAPQLAVCAAVDDEFQERFRDLHATVTSLMQDLGAAEEAKYDWLREDNS